MATYKDDLDILKAAEKADTNKLTFNAITELDNKGMLGMYGGGSASNSAFDLVLWVTGNAVDEPNLVIDGDFDSVYSELTKSGGSVSACVMSNIQNNYKISYKSFGILDLYASNNCVYIVYVSENSQVTVIWGSDGTIEVENTGGGGK